MNGRITSVFLLVALWGAVTESTDPSSLFNLTILHTNDVHCRFEQANKYGGSCTDDEAAAGKCYGGYARLVHQSRAIREKNPNTIFIHGGDFFQGTIWYTIHKWKVVSHFGNLLNLTAMSLGNHEFDDGIDGLLPFVKNANHPVLAANIDTTGEPRVDGLLPKSVVVTVGGRKVGIIGYLTQETSYISSPEGIQIFDEVQGVRDEAKKLKEQGVNILIAVGHAGYLKDMEIAEKVPDIDVVVGGHTNTFLWNGQAPSIEEAQGPYPTVVKQASGRSVPVVQAYAFGKYLGNFMVSFNEEGEVVSWSGLPILMDKSIPQDPFVLNELIPYRKDVDAVAKKEVGRTKVFLDGNRLSCRMVECNLGNFIGDAYVDLFVKYAAEGQWSKVAIALLNGGGIRSSIDERSQNGSITYGDLLGVAPFPNTIDVVKITGQTIKDMLEFSVHDYDPSALEPFGGFLQVSGVQVIYDLTRPKGDRVIELMARCNRCRIPTFHPVKLDEVYEVAMTNFLAGGGDGYALLQGKILEHQLTGILDADVIIEYMSKIPLITNGLERRIRFLNETYRSPCTRMMSPDDKDVKPTTTPKNNISSSDATLASVTTVFFLFAISLLV